MRNLILFLLLLAATILVQDKVPLLALCTGAAMLYFFCAFIKPDQRTARELQEDLASTDASLRQELIEAHELARSVLGSADSELRNQVPELLAQAITIQSTGFASPRAAMIDLNRRGIHLVWQAKRLMRQAAQEAETSEPAIRHGIVRGRFNYTQSQNEADESIGRNEVFVFAITLDGMLQKSIIVDQVDEGLGRRVRPGAQVSLKYNPADGQYVLIDSPETTTAQ